MRRRLFLTIATALVTGAASAQTTYTLVDLGTLGGAWSEARAINSAGQVVGRSALARDDFAHAFLHDGSSLVDLGTLGGPYSEANGISDAGTVVGDASDGSPGNSPPFLWTGGTMTAIDTLTDRGGRAYGIDPTGTYVVGYVAPNAPETQLKPMVYNAGIVTDLSEHLGAWAWAVNASGLIVGTLPGRKRAAVFDGTTTTDLGTLGGRYSDALAVNAGGLVVGRAGLGACPCGTHAFAWTAGAGMTDLGSLDGASEAWGVNDAGDIVGRSFISSADEWHALPSTPLPVGTGLSRSGARARPLTSRSVENGGGTRSVSLRFDRAPKTTSTAALTSFGGVRCEAPGGPFPSSRSTSASSALTSGGMPGTSSWLEGWTRRNP